MWFPSFHWAIPHSTKQFVNAIHLHNGSQMNLVFPVFTTGQNARFPIFAARHGRVGVREVLVAYNIFLTDTTMKTAREIVLNIRQQGLRALSFLVDGHAQISMNLTDLDTINVDTAYDIVAENGNIARAELVGLMPLSALTKVEQSRWGQLNIGADKTIEARFDTLFKVQ